MSSSEEADYVIHYETARDEEYVRRIPVIVDMDNLTAASVSGCDDGSQDDRAAFLEEAREVVSDGGRAWSEIELANGFTIPATTDDDECEIEMLDDEFGDGEYVLVTLYAEEDVD